VNNVCLVIALKDGDRPIGTLDLRGVQNKNRCADLGIQIGEKDCWSQGYGREAIGLVLAYGFNTLNLHRIELTVYADNTRGIRCYEQCGFKAEGRKRQAHFGQGRYHDVLIYGILAEEFRVPRDNAPADRIK
jgi:RimJ/RimL family protein N-acetyltransferase